MGTNARGLLLVERPAHERRPGQQEAFILNRFRTPVRVAILAAAATAGTGVLSETLSADVQADAERTADGVAQQLQQYFVQQGWIAPQ